MAPAFLKHSVHSFVAFAIVGVKVVGSGLSTSTCESPQGSRCATSVRNLEAERGCSEDQCVNLEAE